MQQWLKKIIRGLFSRRGSAIVPMPQFLCENPNTRLELSFDHIISHYLLHQNRVPYFVQIGAFDGISGDPLHFYVSKGLLRGCLLEPQSDAFEQLRVNYADRDGVRLCRAAIGAESGTATLYRVRPGSAGPEWLYQIASFHRDVLMKHASVVPGLEKEIITETVQTITFEDLFAEIGVMPDIIAIDTEGHDFEVIKLLNVSVRKPSLILYEHKHLSSRDQNECIELLAGAGYLMAILGEDTVAYLRGTRNELA